MAERPPLVVVQSAGIVIQDVPSGDLLVVNKAAITPEGGFAIYLNNATGSTITKGTVVQPNTAGGIRPCSAGSSFPIGVAYRDIPTSTSGWIVVGGIAEVFVDNAVDPDWVLLVSTVNAGQCTGQPTVPSATDHWREVGHTLSSTTGSGLVKAVLHFN